MNENMVCRGDIHECVFACELTREIFPHLYQQTWEMRIVENCFKKEIFLIQYSRF